MKDEQKKISFVYLCGVVAVACVYCFARWWNLDGSCLWFDEIFSVHAATHGWRAMIDFVALDLIHPPLFYALLKIWIAIGGESLVWLRLFPFAWTVTAIAPLLLLCRELKLRRAETLTAFALLATNGALIRYAQEVRMYAVVFCLALFSLWLFFKFLNSNLRIVFGALCCVNLLIIYTHYFGWLLVTTECLAICLFRPEKMRRFFASTGVLLACFAPWMLLVWRAALTGEKLRQNIGWQVKPDLVSVARFWMTLSEPFYYQTTTQSAPNLLHIALPASAIILAAIGYYFGKHKQLLLSRELLLSRAAVTASSIEPAVFLLFLTLVPVALAFVASWILPYSVWGARHLIIVFPTFALLTSIAVWRLPHRTLKIVAMVSLGWLIGVGALLHFSRAPQTFIWCGWENLVARADNFKTSAHTTVYVFEDDAAYNLWYRLRRDARVEIVSVDGYADMPEDRAFFLPRGFDEVKVVGKDQIVGERFWLAFRDRARQPDKQILRELISRGYTIGQPLEFRAQGESAFLISVERAKNSSLP